MKKIIIPVIFTLMVSNSLDAQQKSKTGIKTEYLASKITSQQVIDKYLKALGGKEKLTAIKSLITEEVFSSDGMDISVVTKKMGNNFRSTQYVMGQGLSQVFDGEKGYSEDIVTMKMGAQEIAELKKKKMIPALGLTTVDFPAVTVEKIDSKDYNVLTFDLETLYFDALTGLLYKTVSKEGAVFIKRYMIVGGVKFPEEVITEFDGRKTTAKTNKIIMNSRVSDADFYIK